ncbi:MAG TPA: hypothetical protein VEZ90_02745, partial [Blastocatellia bacterium]|nr:hypothetical protein [Blastocatellia bacterium]
MAYFAQVVEEVLALDVGQDYFRYDGRQLEIPAIDARQWVPLSSKYASSSTAIYAILRRFFRPPDR